MPTTIYRLKDGTRVPGVTTIIGRFKDSNGLLFWAFEQGQSGAASLYEKAEVAADIGSIAHDAVEHHLRKEEFEFDESDIGQKAKQAFEQYLTWEKQTAVKVLATEVNLVSEKHRFGGCPDAVGQMDGKYVLLDWKTSNAVYADHLIQLAAYRELWNETHPKMQLSDDAYLCRFSKEYPDFEVRKFSGLEQGWKIFQLYREAYDLDKELRKRVR